MKNEFFPNPKERREIDKRQQEIAAELEPLETEARIRAALIKKELQAETD
jgi:hypothetical protein